MAIPGITAAGTTQATATPLAAIGPLATADVQTVPANSGVILPGGYTNGPQMYLIRNSGANPLSVYPPLVGGVSGTINGSTSPQTVTATSLLKVWAFSPTDWVVS